jgi:cytochrome oxidase assembly protein ShyY1
MKRIVGATLLALFLVALCLQGARWQYDRHEVRHNKNELIRQNITKPSIKEIDLAAPMNVAWRTIEISGRFDPLNEILVRNRYHDGQYGFGVVTLFESDSGKKYWVDRGWVIAGPDAQTPPKVKVVDNLEVRITARVRVEDIESQISGTVFALPGNDGAAKLAKWDKEKSLVTESVYFDLISASRSNLNPDVPTLIPELSDGPHLAYTVQWVLFALMVLFALYLVVREERKLQLEKV